MTTDNTIQLISLALDASLMRQTAIANNVANANTQDYKTVGVNFEEQLNEPSLLGNLSGVKPFYEPTDNQSPIDEQLALGIKNATQYRALIKGLNQKFAIMKLALQGNNGS